MPNATVDAITQTGQSEHVMMTTSTYADRLREAGFRVVYGSDKTVWVSHERFSMLRLPTCALAQPIAGETTNVFKRSKAAALSYAISPSPEHPANALLYVCTDRDYSLDKLTKNARYDVRRGLREFEIRRLEYAEVLSLGRAAYYDTLTRTGRPLAHRDKFEKAFDRVRNDRYFIGALRGGRLAAFMQVIAVDNWVSLGGYSASEFLPLCPNNALIFHIVRYVFSNTNAIVVDYGFSSIQGLSNSDGLHRFKIKMGFEAIPVRRVFTINPLVRPIISRVVPLIMRGLLKLSPHHPLLTKADGALRIALEGHTA